MITIYILQVSRNDPKPLAVRDTWSIRPLKQGQEGRCQGVSSGWSLLSQPSKQPPAIAFVWAAHAAELEIAHKCSFPNAYFNIWRWKWTCGPNFLLLLVLFRLKNPVRMSFLKQYFSNIRVHTHHLRPMLNSRFWLSRWGVEPEQLSSMLLLLVWTTFWVARL